MPGLLCHTHFEKETTNRWRPTPCSHWSSDRELKVCTYNGVKLCRDCFTQARLDSSAHYQRCVAEAAACSDCTALRAADRARIQRNNTIDPDQPYGQHITLTCRNHPELTWHTKNIDHIGARSIFFNGWDKGLTECPCSARYLMVLKPGTATKGG